MAFVHTRQVIYGIRVLHHIGVYRNLCAFFGIIYSYLCYTCFFFFFYIVALLSSIVYVMGVRHTGSMICMIRCDHSLARKFLLSPTLLFVHLFLPFLISVILVYTAVLSYLCILYYGILTVLY